jgi:hypothetical protein
MKKTQGANESKAGSKGLLAWNQQKAMQNPCDASKGFTSLQGAQVMLTFDWESVGKRKHKIRVRTGDRIINAKVAHKFLQKGLLNNGVHVPCSDRDERCGSQRTRRAGARAAAAIDAANRSAGSVGAGSHVVGAGADSTVLSVDMGKLRCGLQLAITR